MTELEKQVSALLRKSRCRGRTIYAAWADVLAEWLVARGVRLQSSLSKPAAPGLPEPDGRDAVVY